MGAAPADVGLVEVALAGLAPGGEGLPGLQVAAVVEPPEELPGHPHVVRGAVGTDEFRQIDLRRVERRLDVGGHPVAPLLGPEPQADGVRLGIALVVVAAEDVAGVDPAQAQVAGVDVAGRVGPGEVPHVQVAVGGRRRGAHHGPLGPGGRRALLLVRPQAEVLPPDGEEEEILAVGGVGQRVVVERVVEGDVSGLDLERLVADPHHAAAADEEEGLPLLVGVVLGAAARRDDRPGRAERRLDHVLPGIEHLDLDPVRLEKLLGVQSLDMHASALLG